MFQGMLSECQFPWDDFKLIARQGAVIDRVPVRRRQYLRALDLGELSGKISIMNEAFNRCSNLRSITWPRGLNIIGCQAFAGVGISVLDLRETGLTEFMYMAFYQCWELVELFVPSSLERIGESCFAGTKLGIVCLSHCLRLIRIEEDAFADCVRLQRVLLPAREFALSCFAFLHSSLNDLELCERPPRLPFRRPARWRLGRGLLSLDRLTYRSSHIRHDLRDLRHWLDCVRILHSGAASALGCYARPLSAPF
jgi:hypothetical protein